MEIITYGCTKTYFYMSENGFFVYSNNSIILFIIVPCFINCTFLFLNVVFYVQHGFLAALWRGRVPVP